MTGWERNNPKAGMQLNISHNGAIKRVTLREAEGLKIGKERSFMTAKGPKTSQTKLNVFTIFNKEKTKGDEGKGLYPKMADAYREVGAEPKYNLSGKQVQSITWVHQVERYTPPKDPGLVPDHPPQRGIRYHIQRAKGTRYGY